MTKKRPLEFKAVLFDLWGTLIYNAPDFIDYADIANQLGVPSHRLFEIWRRYNQAALLGQIQSGAERASLVLSDLGLPLDFVPILTAMEVAGRSTNVFYYPSVPQMLAQLRADGFKLGIVSNSNYLTRGVVEKLDLPQAIDVVILSYEVGLIKPDPTIYELALQKLGVAASDCLYVGDGSDNEMQGANAVGLHTALVEQERGYANRNPGLVYGIDFQLPLVTDVLAYLAA
jgi:putative hydrolase of the HAD superfamily